MGRIYVCPVVVETGRTDPETGAPLPDLQYALIGTLGVTRCRAAISVDMSGQDRGKTRHQWCLCYVEADDWTAVEADDRCFHLTGEVLDDPIRNQVRNQLRNRGYLTQAEVDGLVTNRDAVVALLDKHYPGTAWDRAFPEVA